MCPNWKNIYFPYWIWVFFSFLLLRNAQRECVSYPKREKRALYISPPPKKKVFLITVVFLPSPRSEPPTMELPKDSLAPSGGGNGLMLIIIRRTIIIYPIKSLFFLSLENFSLSHLILFVLYNSAQPREEVMQSVLYVVTLLLLA